MASGFQDPRSWKYDTDQEGLQELRDEKVRGEPAHAWNLPSRKAILSRE
jgi:hypothetical protein